MFSYSVADFLAYDRSIWLAMVGRYLADWWWVGALATVLLLIGLARWLAINAKGMPKLIFLLLSLCWAWVAWQFHWHEHRTLNWAAGYWALGFAVQAGLLVLAVIFLRFVSSELGDARASEQSGLLRRLIWIAIAIALLGPGLTAWLVDATPIFGFEWFGLTPDATALMTLLLLVLWRDGRKWTRAVLAVLPVSSLAISALFSHSLQIKSTMFFAVMGALAMAALFAAPGSGSAQKAAAS